MKQICLFLGLIIFAFSFSSGCRKKGDTIANVYVLDDQNQPVADAQVVLYGTNTASIPSQVAVFDTAMTNVSGMASFNYNDLYQLGQAGVAVLDIKAEFQGMIGQGIIKIEAETVNEETVFIQ
jgi:hypothetical protein